MRLVDATTLLRVSFADKRRTMIYALSHYAAAAAANLESTRAILALLGAVFAYIACRLFAQSGAPSIAPGQERSLGGKLVLISVRRAPLPKLSPRAPSIRRSALRCCRGWRSNGLA